MYVVKRSKSNPILTPSMVGAWGKKGVFNASPIKRGKNRYLVYRAQSGPDPLFAPDGLSTLAISKKISNSEIDKYYEKALNLGAKGGKIAGAGGGGFLLLYCEPEKQENLRRGLNDIKETPFRFTFEGSNIIYVE